MQESGLFIPRNPLRAWFTTSWWLAFVSLGTSLVSGSLAIVVIALLTLAVVTLPFALVGVLVFALMIPPLRYADRAQLWSVKFFSGVVTDRASPPRAATFRARFVESVRGPTLWKSLLHWILRLPLSIAVLALVTVQLIVPVVFAVAPLAWLITDPPGSQLEIAEIFALEVLVLIAGPRCPVVRICHPTFRYLPRARRLVVQSFTFGRVRARNTCRRVDAQPDTGHRRGGGGATAHRKGPPRRRPTTSGGSVDLFGSRKVSRQIFGRRHAPFPARRRASRDQERDHRHSCVDPRAPPTHPDRSWTRRRPLVRSGVCVRFQSTSTSLPNWAEVRGLRPPWSRPSTSSYRRHSPT